MDVVTAVVDAAVVDAVAVVDSVVPPDTTAMSAQFQNSSAKVLGSNCHRGMKLARDS